MVNISHKTMKCTYNAFLLLEDSAEKVRFQKTEKIFRSQMAYNERSALG